MHKKYFLIGLTGLVMILTAAIPVQAAQSPQILLPGNAIPQFVQPLPILNVHPDGNITTVMGNQPLTIRMCEFKANVLPENTVIGYAGTWVWGYLVDPSGTSTCADLIDLYNIDNSGIVDTYIGP